MTVTIDRTAADERAPSPPARLSPTPGTTPVLLDGAWWPRSRGLSRELPAPAVDDAVDAQDSVERWETDGGTAPSPAGSPVGASLSARGM